MIRETMLGIITALPMERGWLGAGGGPGAPTVEVSGVGGRRAREAARRLLSRGVSALASWGVAAGLDPALGAGTVVLPQRVIAAEGQTYQVDRGWQERLRARVGDRLAVNEGDLAHSAHLLETGAAKVELGRRTAAVAADMESGAIAAEAAAAGVPFLAARVILDDAGSPLPAAVASAFDGAGRLQTSALWRSVLGQPQEWANLLRLARSHRVARRSMRTLWRLAAPDLALSGTEPTST